MACALCLPAHRPALSTPHPPPPVRSPSACPSLCALCPPPPLPCSHGFCLFNNAAIGAAYAMNVYRHAGVRRVAILDFDVHHGNGTGVVSLLLLLEVVGAVVLLVPVTVVQ